MLTTTEQACLPPDDLHTRIPGNALEGRIHVLNRRLAIGNENRVARLLERDLQWHPPTSKQQSLLGCALALSDILKRPGKPNRLPRDHDRAANGASPAPIALGGDEATLDVIGLAEFEGSRDGRLKPSPVVRVIELDPFA